MKRMLKQIYEHQIKKFFSNGEQNFSLGFNLVFFCLLTIILFHTLFSSGAVVFSDLDFGFRSSGYIERITDVWNDNWSTSTLFNSSRVYFVFPFFVISFLFAHSVGLLSKLFFLLFLLSEEYLCLF